MTRGNNNRIIAAIVSICIMLTILSATGFALFRGEHHCTQPHCIVCEHLKDLASVSKDLGNGVGAFFAALLISTLFLRELSKLLGSSSSTISLISLKVRMNN
ncbi:hypothetical protein [Clostridium aminobutyricum]|uniref:Uncharacterized protein n=1 Tax=Clostridium aminobutyricum TaxID=33953 RepID=A0A939IGJ5_CLOAM|nr:hypothetical protein [Clostridium aminobutyricum]MBN7773410.1 hypothetical protein [Clostridium aminobutyricum]